MLDVLLFNPYVSSGPLPGNRISRPYPPLGLMSVASVLRRAGYAIELLDAAFQQDASLLEARLSRGPRPRIAVLHGEPEGRVDALRTIELMKERGIVVVALGPDPSRYDAQYLKSGADVVVRCQTERSILELLPAFGVVPEQPDQLPRKPNDEALLAIPGVSILDEDVLHRRAPEIERARPRWDGLPMPAYDLVDVDRYAAEWRRAHGFSSLPFSTTSACAHPCSWCAPRANDLVRRHGSPEQAVDEIEHLFVRYGVEHIMIVDVDFLAWRAWAEDFVSALWARKLPVRWGCRARVEGLDRAMLEVMREAGCEGIDFELESGSERVLARLGRGEKLATTRRVAKDMHALGLAMRGDIFLGHPGEAWADVEDTIALLRDLTPIDYALYDVADDGRIPRLDPTDASASPPRAALYPPALLRVIEALVAAEYEHALESSIRGAFKIRALRILLGAIRLHAGRGASARPPPVGVNNAVAEPRAHSSLVDATRLARLTLDRRSP